MSIIKELLGDDAQLPPPNIEFGRRRGDGIRGRIDGQVTVDADRSWCPQFTRKQGLLA